MGMLALPRGKAVMFADDTALLFSGRTWREAYECAQLCFSVVSKCLRSNLLTLNSEKTHYITFSSKGNPSTPPFASHYTILAILAHSCPEPHSTGCACPPLQKTHTIKYLGVVIDNVLGFHEHIRRLRKLMYVFKTVRCVLDTKWLKSVYFALVQSVLTYCITIWGGAPKSSVSRNRSMVP